MTLCKAPRTIDCAILLLLSCLWGQVPPASASEEVAKIAKTLAIPATGSQIKVELIDHTTLAGKLIAQKSESVHLNTGSALLVISISDIVAITQIAPPKTADAPAVVPPSPASAPAQPDPTALAAKQEEKPSQKQAATEEDVEIPGKKTEPEVAPEKALAQKLGLGQGDGDKKAPRTTVQPNAKPEQANQAEAQGGRDWDRVLDQSVDLLETGRPIAAAQNLRQIARTGDPHVLARADTVLRARYRRSLAETLAICYMQETCADCKGSGLVVCPDCGGQGYLTRVITRRPSDKVEPGTHKLDKALGMTDPVECKEFMRDQLCARCRGHGFDPCETCRGTRNRFIEPTPYEKAAYADHLASLGDELLRDKESSYGDTGRTAAPTYDTREEARMKPMLQQVWLRDTANQVKSDILRLWRAQQYYAWAIKADPTLVLRSTQKNYPQEQTKILARLRLLYGEFAERQQVYMANRAENRLDELNYYEFFGKNVNNANSVGTEKFKDILTDQ